MQKWFKILVILAFVSVATSDFAIAQKTPIVKDTTKVYQNIESFSVKRKSTRFLYQILFTPVNINAQKKDAKKKIYKKR